MKLSAAVNGVGAALRRPADLLPLYLLGAAVPAIVRVVPFLGLAASYLYLVATGRLEAIRAELAGLDLEPPGPQAEPEAAAEWAEGFEPVVEQALAPFVVAVVGLAGLVAVVAFVGLSAVVAAGQLAACRARLRDERGLTAGLEGLRRYWLRFLGLSVLEVVLWIGITGVVGGGAGIVVAAVAAAGLWPIAVLVALAGAVLWGIAVAAVRAIFAFAPVAVVVDDAGVGGSLRATLGFVRARPVEATFYYVAAILALGALAGVGGAVATVGVPSFASLLAVLAIWPALDLLKTALYAGYRDAFVPPTTPTIPLRTQFGSGLRRGWADLVTFVRESPGLHALAVAVAVATTAAGWLAADPFAGIVEASIAARLDGHFPPTAALEFFGNNWTVALTTAYSGLALGIPALALVAFNGIVIGATARLEVDPLELAAFVAPHGVVEVPAILIAGALGVHLGILGWRTWRGRLGCERLADELERSFRVLVGVGLLLAVAALIEGFVSPYLVRPFA